MNLNAFLIHAQTEHAPDPVWSPALQALWYAERGDWETAHEVCQKGDTAEGAWVHATLHREEGDLGNARYWYSRAGKPESEGSFQEERRNIISALLPS